jgi:hypothetical protein
LFGASLRLTPSGLARKIVPDDFFFECAKKPAKETHPQSTLHLCHRNCSGLVCVQGKARCAGNGHCPWQAPQRGHGRTQANPKGGSRLSRPGVAPLAKAISLPCTARLVAKQPGVAAAANGTGAECLGCLSFAPFFGHAKKRARARHPNRINTGNADSRPKRTLALKTGKRFHYIANAKR